MVNIGRKLLIVGIALTLLTGLATAQENLKIGFLEAVKIIDDAPQGQAALKEIQEELAPREDALAALQQDIAAKSAELQASESLSGEGREALEQEIRSMTRQLERGQEELREDFNIRRNEELNKLQELIGGVIAEMALDEGFDLILQEPVVFAGERINITDLVLQRLKDKFEESQ